MRRYLVVGGAGFIGSHFVDRLIADGEYVRIFDDFSSGRDWHFAHHEGKENFAVTMGNAESIRQLAIAMTGIDTVIHLASNADIAAAALDPTIDFYKGTLLTQCVLEAMRRSQVGQLIYASGSGVYGDAGERELTEWSALNPTSPYGASKLAGESLIHCYAEMFGLRACIFRFANVVGARQTHGVVYDFLRKLRDNPTRLQVLGNGQQSKSYIHVSDVINAVMVAQRTAVLANFGMPVRIYNVGTGDYVTVQDIAHVCASYAAPNAVIEFGESPRGWAGDVPIVRLNTDKIRAHGWVPTFKTRDAIRISINELRNDMAEHG